MSFATTRWSLVLKAADSGPESHQAIEELCQTYWKPVFVFIRGRGYSVEDAKDLTQQFFLFVIEKDLVARARRDRGRFRHFLRASIKNFLANEWDKTQAQKRGGGQTRIEINGLADGNNLEIFSNYDAPPDVLFERAWALALLGSVLATLRQELEQRGRAELFDALKPRLTGQEVPRPYVELSREFGMTESAIKLVMHRIKRRFRELLRNEILETVSTQQELDQELIDLREALSRNSSM